MKFGRIALLLFVLVMTAAVVLPVRADEGVQVSLTADKAELTVGEPVRLTLAVTHPAGYQVIIPKLEQVWGDLEVRSQSQATTMANDDGTETTSQVLEAVLFDLGEFQTPEMVLTIGDGAGGVSEAVVSSIPLVVNPTLAEDDNDLRDIKPQAQLAVPAAWPWIVGGLLAAVAAGIAGWWVYRRRQGKPFGLVAVDNRPPWQVATDELTRIEGLGLLHEGRFKEYYTLVTDVLRTYLETQFNLNVFDRTTSELRTVFRLSDLTPEHARALLDLFADSDLVKFAKFTPDVETARHLIARARYLVDVTSREARAAAEPESDLESFFADGNPPVSGAGGKGARVKPASAGA